MVKLLQNQREREKFQSQRKWPITYRRIMIGMRVDISSKIMEARRHWNDIFKVLKEKIKKNMST